MEMKSLTIGDNIYDLPRGGGDWNVNDPDADDYIKNRPFYKGEENIITLIPETTIDVTEGEARLEVEDGGIAFNIAKDNVGKIVKMQCNDVIEYGLIEEEENSYYVFGLNINIDMNKNVYQISVYIPDATNVVIHASINNTEINKINSDYLPIPSIEGTVVGSIILNGVVSNCKADGRFAVAEGYSTIASGYDSHAEGYGAESSGRSSHAEGEFTIASGDFSRAEGSGTTASGEFSHAEGQSTTASGQCSHAEGMETIANHAHQHVFGEFNISDPSSAIANARGNYVEIVGNGTYKAKSNARTLDWSGNETLQGSLTLGKGTADETTVTAAQLKALLAMLAS